MSAALALGVGLVLDDHVDVDVRLGQRGREPAGDAGRVGHADERHAGLPGRVGDGGDEGLLHGFLCSDHHGTGRVIEARPAVDPDAVIAGVLDGAQLQDAGAARPTSRASPRRRPRQLAGVRDDARVGGEDAGDVGVDLALVGADGGGQRDGGRVRAAAAERRDVVGGRHALEARDEDDRVLVEALADAVGAHLEDSRLRVRRVCHDPGLRSGEGDRTVAEVVDRHGAQRARLALARRQEHVHLARIRVRGDLLRPGDELVGGLSARAEHRDDAQALPRAWRRCALRRA